MNEQGRSFGRNAAYREHLRAQRAIRSDARQAAMNSILSLPDTSGLPALIEHNPLAKTPSVEGSIIASFDSPLSDVAAQYKLAQARPGDNAELGQARRRLETLLTLVEDVYGDLPKLYRAATFSESRDYVTKKVKLAAVRQKVQNRNEWPEKLAEKGAKMQVASYENVGTVPRFLSRSLRIGAAVGLIGLAGHEASQAILSFLDMGDAGLHVLGSLSTPNVSLIESKYLIPHISGNFPWKLGGISVEKAIQAMMQDYTRRVAQATMRFQTDKDTVWQSAKDSVLALAGAVVSWKMYAPFGRVQRNSDVLPRGGTTAIDAIGSTLQAPLALREHFEKIPSEDVK